MESTASEPCPYTEGHRNEEQKDKEYWFGRGRGKCPWMDRFNHTRGVIRAIQLLTGNDCERAHQFLYQCSGRSVSGPPEFVRVDTRSVQPPGESRLSLRHLFQVFALGDALMSPTARLEDLKRDLARLEGK